MMGRRRRHSRPGGEAESLLCYPSLSLLGGPLDPAAAANVGDGGVYYVRIEGDRHRMVAADICEVIQERYAVRASLLTADKTPVRFPLVLKLSVRDCWGRETHYAHMWEVCELEPGARGLRLDTGLTSSDLDGVRATVEARVGG